MYKLNSLSDYKILITGAAGFIGYHLTRYLLDEGLYVIGIDNLNDYYDTQLKYERLSVLKAYDNFNFIKADISNNKSITGIFSDYRPDIVINLAAQAGVRYSIIAPESYITSNIVGFFNILESCRKYPVKQLIYASSSSVYGNQKDTPFSTENKTDMPVSLYAATKKSDELIAYAYSHLYHIPTIGLRFFTVYGPYGRPDMAYFSFTEKILKEEKIQIFNNGELYRDFTYIDDIIKAIVQILLVKNESYDYNKDLYEIYNIGNSKPEKLTHFIEILEELLGKKAIKEYLPMQPGDVYMTYAEISDLKTKYNFNPETNLKDGLKQFINWYLKYYNI